jgi:hypothetical protein
LLGIIANGAIFMRALAAVPSFVAPSRRPRPAVRDRALKPWRLMTVAEKEAREAR